MASVSISCPSCSATDGVVRNGKSTAGHQRYLCSHCRKTWQLQFTYTASQPGTHQKIIDMAMNGVGCRATARIMGVGLNTILVTSRIQPGSDVIVCAEMDEQWGYVGAKSRQRWLFYAYDSLRKTVVAHVFGERTMATLGRLMSLLSPSRQRWLFYAYDSLRKTVVAHVFGERTMATLGRLMSLLSPFDVVIWMTDGWPLYESRLKGKLHVIS
ncbi:IS1 family transposase, partial [Escherichia coli]|uniref:IS1 family transposase n=1 Tax=Escherichia coli TaxID=562 RepID=UPI002F25FC1C